jgi:hypothetical protein
VDRFFTHKFGQGIVYGFIGCRRLRCELETWGFHFVKTWGFTLNESWSLHFDKTWGFHLVKNFGFLEDLVVSGAQVQVKT